MGREPGIGPAQLTCPNTDTDHGDQSVPVLFAPLFLEGRVLTAAAAAWDLAVRRAEVIGQLAGRRTVAWRPRTRRRPSWACRGGERLPDEVEAVVRQVLRTRYLTRQRRTVASVYREITRECKVRGLPVPSRGTVLRRIAKLDPVRAVSAREDADAARALRPAGGTPPEITRLLDHGGGMSPFSGGCPAARFPYGLPASTVEFGPACPA
jgi:hypothetical protein